MRDHTPQHRLLYVFAAAALLGVSCGDADPVAPQLDRLTLTLPVSRIELGDSVRAEARALRNETEIPSAQITWRTSDPAVLSVSSDGTVTGRGPGVADVIAEAGGRRASATLEVLGWNIADGVEVVDSTVLDLLTDDVGGSDVLRFRVHGATAPSFSAGTVLVGAQGGGFLRRVVSTSLVGDELVVNTAPAALAEIVEAGSFSSSVDLIFAPMSGGRANVTGAQDFVWGAGEFTYLAPGVSAAQAGFDLSDVDLCDVIAQTGGSCPAGIKALEIESGVLDFQPGLDVAATFEGFSLLSFRGVASGTLTADIALRVDAEGELGSYEASPRFFTFTRPFYAMLGPVPVVGYVELMLEGELSIGATAKASLEAGFTGAGNVEIGAEYENGSWEPVVESGASFDPRLPTVSDGTLSGGIEVSARLGITPRLQMIFYGVVGPYAQATPRGEAKLTFGTECGFEADVALDAEIGFTVPFLDDDVADFAHEEDPLVQGPSMQWPCPLGTIDVTTITNGADPDTDGYEVLVDGSAVGTIAPDGSLTVPFLPEGSHEVTLDDIAPNCTAQGGATREIAVTAGGLGTVDFTIDCTALTGSIEVRTRTSGVSPDLDGYALSLDGGAAIAIGSDASHVFEGVSAGPHTLDLTGIAANCVVAGPNPADVEVAPDAVVTHTFDVACSGGSLNVSVSTQGDPEQSSYTISAGNRELQIAVNGSAAFDDLPAGALSVRLDDVPSHCVVQGANPRIVEVPGAVAFEVICQAPTACSEPPEWIAWDPPHLTLNPRITTAGGAGSHEVLSQEYDHTAIRVTASGGDTDEYDGITSAYDLSAKSLDYWQFVPIDSTLIGTRAFVRVRHEVLLATAGAFHSEHAHASVSAVGVSAMIDGHQLEPLAIDTTVSVEILNLGEWESQPFEMYVYAWSWNGGFVMAEAHLKTSFVEVVDENQVVIPIREICTLSGAAYGQAQSGPSWPLGTW